MEESNQSDTGSTEALNKRISDLEAQIIAQEHRWPKVISNFWHRNEGGESQRKAAISAFIWRIVMPGSTIAAGGGLAAVGTLLFLAIQTNLMREQNGLIQKQNGYFQEQIARMQEQNNLARTQADLQRWTQTTSYLYETNLNGPIASARTRTEALVELAKLSSSEGRPLALSGAHLEETDVDSANFQFVDFRGAFLEKANFYQCKFYECEFDHPDNDGILHMPVRKQYFSHGNPRFIRCLLSHSSVGYKIAQFHECLLVATSLTFTNIARFANGGLIVPDEVAPIGSNVRVSLPMDFDHPTFEQMDCLQHLYESCNSIRYGDPHREAIRTSMWSDVDGIRRLTLTNPAIFTQVSCLSSNFTHGGIPRSRRNKSRPMDQF